MTNRNRGGGLIGPSLSRRRLLRNSLFAAGGLALTGPLLSACGGDSSSGGGGDKVVVADWGGAIQDAEKEHLYGPFTKETGIEVVISGPPSDAKIKAMVDSGNVEWDLVAGGLSNVLGLGRDYFEEFPESVLTVEGIAPEFIDKQAVAYYVFATNMGWNTDMLGGKRMESWADFWDTKAFPGKRSLMGAEGGGQPSLEFALLADGVAMEDLYPLDVDRAFAKMDELKSSVPQWWSSGAQPGQMMVSKQVSSTSIWSGRVFTLQEENAPIDFSWNGGMLQPASWIVPKGAKNKEAAFKLAEYSLQADVQARLWGNYPSGATNSKAYDSMPEEHARKLPTYPEWAALQFVQDAEWWGENREGVLKKWAEFALS